MIKSLSLENVMVSPAKVLNSLNSCVAHSRREGQKVFTSIFFFPHRCIFYKGGIVYIKHEPLSSMPCYMDSVAPVAALWD